MTVEETAAQAEELLYQRRSFSQFGEDAVLAWMFPEQRNGFYVDIGCHHPFRISNTALLHINQGWRGLNIDVDERAISAFNRYRPNDINVCSGVAGAPGIMEVTIFDEGAVNTFDPVAAANPAWAHFGKIKKMVEVDTLKGLLDRYLPPATAIDMLNLDAEGLDLEILNSNDWSRYRPRVILVEGEYVDIGTLREGPIHALLKSHGYSFMSQVAITSFYRIL